MKAQLKIVTRQPYTYQLHMDKEMFDLITMSLDCYSAETNEDHARQIAVELWEEESRQTK